MECGLLVRASHPDLNLAAKSIFELFSINEVDINRIRTIADEQVEREKQNGR